MQSTPATAVRNETASAQPTLPHSRDKIVVKKRYIVYYIAPMSQKASLLKAKLLFASSFFFSVLNL